MKYVIAGAGGTGASIGGFLAANGCDVALIARGKHLEAVKKHGLIIHSDKRGKMRLENIKAMTADEYAAGGYGPADVIFVAVKYYSIDEIVPFLAKASDEHTIIIPILNVYKTGLYLAQKLADAGSKANVLEGCIYIVAYICAPGEIVQSGSIFRVVYGTRGASKLKARLEKIKADLEASGINAVLSEKIADDTFRKFTFVSPFAAAGAYYNVSAGAMQRPGREFDLYTEMVKECAAVAKAYDIKLPDNILEINRSILNALSPDTTASMQKDLARGGRTEMDGLIFEMVRMARAKNMRVPAYEKAAAHFGFVIDGEK